MSVLARWGKFNVVGVIGATAQLASLAALNRVAPKHYLVTTVIALELTLLHNFVWHVHYTWRERRQKRTMVERFVRFHLSNGMVSLVGNLALMKVFVTDVGLSVLVANGIAILCCSLVNFLLGEKWVFGAKRLQINSG